MKSRKSLTMVLAALLIALILPAAALAQPAVSVECAYDNPTSNDLVCEVWVDTQGDTLRSGGVLVNFDSSILSNAIATKDPAWVFTDGSTNYSYMPPEVGAGTVLFIVGMLNTTDTNLGITGKAKIGGITFTRNATPVAGTAGADQATFFGISATLGRPDPYVNFVNTAGTNLDSSPPSFTAIAAERGDANTDGAISPSDYIAIRGNLSSINAPPYMDCNNDGSVSPSDYICVRGKLP